MFDTPDGRKWAECQLRLNSCTEAFSAAQGRFLEILNQRENLHSPIRAAEKTGDSAVLAALYEEDRRLDGEYDAAARAFAEAHRNLEITCQECKRAISTSGISPPNSKSGRNEERQ